MHFRKLLKIETISNITEFFLNEINLRMPQEHELDYLYEHLNTEEKRKLRFFVNNENHIEVVNTCNDIVNETNRQLKLLLNVE